MPTHLVPLRDGRRVMEVERCGKEDGEPVWFFHGHPGSAHEVHVGGFAAEELGMELFGTSRPGIGQSTYKAGWKVTDFPRDLEDCAAYFGHEKFSLLGVSGGAPFTAVHGVLLEERIKMMTIVSGMAPIQKPGVLNHMRWFNRQFLTVAQRLPDVFVRFGVWRLLQKFGKVKKGQNVAMREINKGLPSVDTEVFNRPEMLEVQRRQLIDASRQGIDGIVQDICNLARPWGFFLRDAQVPTDLWHGLEDESVPPQCMQYLAKDMPHARKFWVPGQGHTLLLVNIGDVLREMKSRIQGLKLG